MGNMGSAHPLVEVNIWAKFEENHSIGIGVIERKMETDRRTDQSTNTTKGIHYSPPPHILWWGYNNSVNTEWTQKSNPGAQLHFVTYIPLKSLIYLAQHAK
jgi:hypothetical protein